MAQPLQVRVKELAALHLALGVALLRHLSAQQFIFLSLLSFALQRSAQSRLTLFHDSRRDALASSDSNVEHATAARQRNHRLARTSRDSERKLRIRSARKGQFL
jgi:hypothetical protein